ncbi:MAG: (4Fe-4S)-binding protein [Draconibacterium sp.]
MEKEIKKHYSNGELTVVWKPGLCIHSGVCVRTLPQVYNTKERPWIKPGNATTEELKAQINRCPSGALSYFMNNEKGV